MDITFSLFTCNRTPNYCPNTLRRMFEQDSLLEEHLPLHIYIDGPSDSFLGDWAKDHRVRTHVLEPARWNEVRAWPLYRKVCANFVRAMRAPAPGYLCVLEDDLDLRELWVNRLEETLIEMDKDHFSDFGLSLFTPYDFDMMQPSQLLGERYCSYGAPYHGTLGMAYPKATAASVADYVEAHGVITPSWAPDILVGRALAGRLFACPRPLVDHIGSVSTGLGGGGRSAAFARPYMIFPKGERNLPLPLRMLKWA